MKKRFLLFVLCALVAGTFFSCNDTFSKNYPILYVVNGTDYAVNVYCDNRLVATADAHNNSEKVELNNTSINLPVFVEAEFYDNKGKRVKGYTWNSYYFSWNKSYKMTLANSSSSSSLKEL